MSSAADEPSTSPTPPLSVDDRLAAFTKGAPKIPRKVLYVGLAALLVLGVGGVLLQNVLSSSGAPSGTTTGPNSTPTTFSSTTPLLSAPLNAFMAYQREDQPAPSFSLQRSSGATVSLAALHGRVVVLSFFDARCRDICPIEAAEFRIADRELGRSASRVAFATINIDPASTAPSDARLAGVRSGLSGMSNWLFLTGPLATLNSVWSSYGVAVDYQPSTGALAHSEYIYLINANGTLTTRLTPFANETKHGTYELDQASINRFGSGLATYVERLLK